MLNALKMDDPIQTVFKDCVDPNLKRLTLFSYPPFRLMILM